LGLAEIAAFDRASAVIALSTTWEGAPRPKTSDLMLRRRERKGLQK
jgi:hypothetical protein